jgi:hypothetical protein
VITWYLPDRVPNGRRCVAYTSSPFFLTEQSFILKFVPSSFSVMDDLSTTDKKRFQENFHLALSLPVDMPVDATAPFPIHNADTCDEKSNAIINTQNIVSKPHPDTSISSEPCPADDLDSNLAPVVNSDGPAISEGLMMDSDCPDVTFKMIHPNDRTEGAEEGAMYGAAKGQFGVAQLELACIVEPSITPVDMNGLHIRSIFSSVGKGLHEARGPRELVHGITHAIIGKCKSSLSTRI